MSTNASVWRRVLTNIDGAQVPCLLDSEVGIQLGIAASWHHPDLSSDNSGEGALPTPAANLKAEEAPPQGAAEQKRS